MKSIKFRWYSEANEKMIYFDLNEGEGFDPKKDDIMQFTGLLDRNGKEIYEQDIIYFGKEYQNGIVEFKNGEFCTDTGERLQDINKENRVIGNIY